MKLNPTMSTSIGGPQFVRSNSINPMFDLLRFAVGHRIEWFHDSMAFDSKGNEKLDDYSEQCAVVRCRYL